MDHKISLPDAQFPLWLKIIQNGQHIKVTVVADKTYPPTMFIQKPWKNELRGTLVKLSAIVKGPDFLFISQLYTKRTDEYALLLPEEKKRLKGLGRFSLCQLLQRVPSNTLIALEASGYVRPVTEEQKQYWKSKTTQELSLLLEATKLQWNHWKHEEKPPSKAKLIEALVALFGMRDLIQLYKDLGFRVQRWDDLYYARMEAQAKTVQEEHCKKWSSKF